MKHPPPDMARAALNACEACPGDLTIGVLDSLFVRCLALCTSGLTPAERIHAATSTLEGALVAGCGMSLEAAIAAAAEARNRAVERYWYDLRNRSSKHTKES
jgi:hypothetical protein